MFVNFVHAVKAFAPIDFNAVPLNTISLKEVQLINAFAPISTTFSGITTLVKLAHFAKAFSPIITVLSEIEQLVIIVLFAETNTNKSFVAVPIYRPLS